MSNVIIESGVDPVGVSPVRTEAVVDQSRAAQRISISPIEWRGPGEVLGFYGVAQASGATVSLAAAAHTAALRWTDATHYLVLMRLRVGYSVTGAITTSTPMDLQGVIVRGFTVDFTTNATVINMGTVSNTNKFRQNFGASLLGTKGPEIATTAAMSGQTLTADTAPFAMASYQGLVAVTATGTAVAAPAGAAAPMQDLYKWDVLGGHPIVLSVNEGIVVQPVTAGPATGSVKYYVQWEWAEVRGF